jgi:hypothetical protein
MDFKKKEKIKSILNNNKKKELIFVHTPKCGGTFVISILNDLNIKNIGHKQAPKDDNLYFTVIRDPVDRFESLLNFRLGMGKALKDWPTNLLYIFENKDKIKDLNCLMDELSDENILSFTPYCSLIYWSKNVEIFITIEELKDFFNLLNLNFDETKYVPLNVSNKNYGKLNEKNKKRIKKLFKHDIIFYSNNI